MSAMSFAIGPAPQTRRDDVVEILHGRTIEDPYRWLEDADSPDTVDWVERQRAFTEEAFTKLRTREAFRNRLTELYSLPGDTIDKHCGGRYLMWHDDGDAAQPVVQAAEDWRDLFDRPITLLDPNDWSEDGTTSLKDAAISPDGSTLAWASSAAGSDWTSFTLRNVATGEERDRFVTALKEEHQVGSGVYYPIPNHRLPSLAPYAPGLELPNTEKVAAECVSLPVHPSLSQADLERIVAAVNACAKAGA